MKTNSVKYITLFLALLVFFANTKNTDAASPKKNTVLIHVVSNIKKDDGPPCVAFDIAFAYVKLGYKVQMLFDADAAWNLKLSGKDRKNDFDRYNVPDDLKKLVTQQIKDNNFSKVKNFGEFLEYLSKSGVKIYVNGTWNVLTSAEKTLKGKENMPDYSIPVDLKEMTELLSSANTYMRY